MNIEKSILKYISEVVLITDSKGIITYCSDNIKKTFGWTSNELLNSLLFEKIFTDDKTAINSAFNSLNKNKNTFECRFLCKSTKIKWIKLTVTNCTNDANINGILFSLVDMSRQKTIEESLLAHKKNTRFFIEKSPLPIAIFDTNMCYIAASNSWLSDYKLGSQNLIGRSHYEVFPEITDKWKEDHKAVLSGEIYKNAADKFVRKDGSIQWLKYELFPWFKSDNSIGGIVMFTEDITEQKRAKDKLINAMNLVEENGFFLQESQRVGNIGSYKLDIKTDLWISTETLDGIFGIDKSYKKDVEGWRKLVHPEDTKHVDQYIENIVLTRKIDCNCKYRIIRINDQKVRWVHVLGKVAFDKNNNIATMMGTIQDITERKTYEELILEKNHELEVLNEELKNSNNKLVKAIKKAEEANRLKSEFLKNISHEVRTPLNGIVGFSELLMNSSAPTQSKEQYLKVIKNSSFQLIRIIEDILEISNLDTNQHKIKKEKIALNELIQELVSIYNIKAEKLSVPIIVKKGFNDNNCFCFTDKMKLTRILGNLIENAIKFTKKGYIEIGYSVKNQTLLLYVKDTGNGISDKDQKIIFDRFAQGEKSNSELYGGLGLGLSISKENAKIIGGTITLESVKGIGSTFYLTLPFNNATKIN